MTDTFPDKKPDNKTQSGFAPEISTLRHKKAINLIPKLAFFGGAVLVLVFLLYSYFKDLASELLFGTEPPRKAMVVVIAISQTGATEAKLLWVDYNGRCRD